MTVEIREGRGVGPQQDHIHLHLEHLDPAILHERLPGISETAKVFAGVDVTKQPIPVLPTVHYNMGGIPTNYMGEALRPTIGNPDAVVPGLMAVGEAACASVHGANRLGCNSLIDLVVFGRAAAIRAAEVVKPGTPHKELPASAGEDSVALLDRLRNAKGSLPTSRIRGEMQRTMQNNCAVFRTTEVLEEGCQKIDAAAASMAEIHLTDRSLIWNSDLVEAIELENLMGQALVTLHSARARKESRGAHAHENHPERDDVNWLKHTLSWRDAKGVRLDYRPVHLKPLTVETIPPKARTY
jgi:succinate dehydrogenase / fumarate reductase flavoprotein subunit